MTREGTGAATRSAPPAEYPAAVAVKTIETGIIPPTINLEVPDLECDLAYVPNDAQSQRVRAVLSNNLGFGGQNAALVFRAWE